jgi:hypothetical protein
MQHRARGEHLGIDQRMPCKQTVKIPAVPVRPFHHRRDAETTAQFHASQMAQMPPKSKGIARR